MLWFGRCVRTHSFSWFDPCVCCARGLVGVFVFTVWLLEMLDSCTWFGSCVRARVLIGVLVRARGSDDVFVFLLAVLCSSYRQCLCPSSWWSNKQDDSTVLIGMLMLWFGRFVRAHSFSWFVQCVCSRGLFGRCVCVHSLVDWNARGCTWFGSCVLVGVLVRDRGLDDVFVLLLAVLCSS